MGGVIALVNKRGEDATEAALAMLNKMSMERVDSYGIASSFDVKIENTLDKLRSVELRSSIAVGHAFSKILAQDKAQPLQTWNNPTVFEGRIFPNQYLKFDAEVFAQETSEGDAETARSFIKKTGGDFVFVMAKPKRLLAGRDVLGAKPFYYGENSGFAAVASERKALWAIGIKETNSFPPGTVTKVNEHGFSFMPAKRILPTRLKPQTIEHASKRLEQLLRKSVRERTAGLDEVAVAFSGGLDSSVIAFLAKKLGVQVQLVHVSLQNQAETEHAKIAAEQLKLPIHLGIFTQKDVQETLTQTLRLIEEPDPVKTSVGIPFFWMAKTATRLQCRVVLAGQGGDEFFGGYRRYVDQYLDEGSEKVQQTIFQDVTNLYRSNLERDVKICNFHGVELRLPFAKYAIAKFALSLPLDLKLQPMQNTPRKLVLRQVGRNLGLPPSVTEKPKKAMQYATGVNRVLDRLAKLSKLSLTDYLNKTYRDVLKKHRPS
jgi:asparagine synthase (glutamine-hydrolysing)